MSRRRQIFRQTLGALAVTGAVASAAVGDPVLTIVGECPGVIEATVTGATPGDVVAVLFSTQTGSCMIPSQNPCGGFTVVDLRCRTLQLAAVILIDENGEGSIAEVAGERACGGYLQAIDLMFCTTSNVVRLE